MQGSVVDSGLCYLLQLGVPRRRMQGAVHWLSVLLASQYALGSSDLRDRVQVFVCVVGAAWRDVWCDLGGATCMFSCAPPTIGC